LINSKDFRLDSELEIDELKSEFLIEFEVKIEETLALTVHRDSCLANSGGVCKRAVFHLDFTTKADLNNCCIRLDTVYSPSEAYFRMYLVDSIHAIIPNPGLEPGFIRQIIFIKDKL